MDNEGGKLNIQDPIGEAFRKNEYRTNRMCSKALFWFTTLILICGILGESGFYLEQFRWSSHYLIIGSGIGYLLNLLTRFIGYDSPKVKSIIIGDLIFLSGMAYMLFPLTTVFLMFGPVFLSVKYYDPKFTVRVTVATWLTFLLTVLANTGLEHHLAGIREYHLYLGSLIWQDIPSVFFYQVIPRTMIYLFEGIVGYYIATAGRRVVKEQAESSRKAAAMEAELSTAAQIQKKTLAKPDFETGDKSMAIHAYISPAKDVGGDFYDHFMVNDHLLVVTVADVSDKGLPAAMFGIEAQSNLRFALSEALSKDADGIVEFIDLEKAVNGVNRQLCVHNMDGMFVTMWIGCFDTRTGVGKYINAGHCLPYVKRADGSLRRLDSEPQFFLGSFENAEYKASPIRLRGGETLFLYTDGVTDARNKGGEVFGTDRLEAVLAKASVSEKGPNGQYLTGTVCRELKTYIGDETPYDDITILTLFRAEDSHSNKKTVLLETGDDCGERVIEEINSIIMPLGCPEFKRRNLNVAVDEICANICEYAYGGEKGTVEIEIHWEENYIGIRFIDSGAPFNPLEQESPDLSGEPEIGGLGIHLIKNLVDRLSYERRDGKNLFTVYIAWNM